MKINPALLFAASVPFVARSSVTVTPVAPAIARYIAVLTPASPGWAAALRSLNLSADLDPVVPYSVIVENLSPNPLRGIAVAFEETESASGASFGRRFTSVNLDPQAGPVFPPLSLRWYVPSEPLYQAARGQASSRNLPVAGIAAELARMTISVSIDSIITSDGKLWGPDKLDTFTRIQAEQKARAHLAHILATSADRIADLSASATSVAGEPATMSEAYYREHLLQQVRHWTNVISSRSAENFSVGLMVGFIAAAGREIPISH